MTDKNRAFITGGASGLGRALARCFTGAGWKVCIGDINDQRGEETLAELRSAGAECHYLYCDVTQESDLQAAADWLRDNWGGVDVVINNAGVAVAGGIADLSLADWEWAVNINLLGVVRGCKVFTPLLRAQGGGHLVNVASLAGLIHPPRMGAYNATKAAVVALSETLSVELVPDHIKVSVVCPEFFRTNLAESLRASDASMEQITNRLVNKAKFGAEEIAEKVFAGIQRGDFHILPHAHSRGIWRMKRWLPFSRYREVMIKRTQGMMRQAS